MEDDERVGVIVASINARSAFHCAKNEGFAERMKSTRKKKEWRKEGERAGGSQRVIVSLFLFWATTLKLR